MEGRVEVKRGNPEVLPELVEVVDEVMRKGVPQGYRMGDEFPHLFSIENSGNLYYVEIGGQPVSHAGIKKWKAFIEGKPVSVASLGSVATLPEHRGHGYASSILDRILSDLRRDRISLLLVSGSRNLYSRAGCVETGLVLSTEISASEAERLRLKQDLEVNPVSDRSGAVEWALQLYNSENYRFERDDKLMEILLSSVWFRRMNFRMELFEIVSNSVRVAYAVAFKKKGEEKVTVMEYAGSRPAVAGSLKQISDLMKADAIEMKIHPSDSELIHIFRKNGIIMRESRTQGTVRVVDPENLVCELEKVLEKRGIEVNVIDHGKGIQFARGKNRSLASGPSEITKAFFGTSESSMAIPLMFTDDLNYI